MMRKLALAVAIVCAFAFVLLATSGPFLVRNHPQSSDVIVALAGETDRRPGRAIELLSQGLAPRLLLDVPGEDKVYGVRAIELARQYVNQWPQKDAMAICPIFGLSTKSEAHDVARCFE